MPGDLAPAAVATLRGIAAAGDDQKAQAVRLGWAINEKAGRLDLAYGADMKAVGLDGIRDFQVQRDALAAGRRGRPQGNEFLRIAWQVARLGLRTRGARQHRASQAKPQQFPPI